MEISVGDICTIDYSKFKKRYCINDDSTSRYSSYIWKVVDNYLDDAMVKLEPIQKVGEKELRVYNNIRTMDKDVLIKICYELV